MDIIDQTIQQIKSLQVQGATSIVKASLNALKIWSEENKRSIDEFKKKAEALSSARPTEPFVTNFLKWTVNIKVIGEREKILDEITEKIISFGVNILQDKKIILTHCHSSSVENILKKLHEKNKKLEVFVTKTEPLHQGEITAKNLAGFGVKVTMINDNEAAFMISKEDNQRIDTILIGADAIISDGSIINKVGSYGIALSAKNANVPLYIVASLLKFTDKEIKIEERSGSEIWDKPPEGVLIFNPAFDKVPKEFITGIITESGMIKPSEISKTAQKTYPEIFL